MTAGQPAAAVAPVSEPPVWHLLVLDDYVTFADALAARLEAEPRLRVSVATTIEQARRVLRDHHFDALLLDLDLDGRSGLRFMAEALTGRPDLRIVIVTGAKDERQVMDAVQLGVHGWVLKDSPIEHLLAVIYGAFQGETWIPPRLLTAVIAELKCEQAELTEREMLLARLTQREKEILGLLVTGMSTDAIAGHLVLSRNTVRTHIQHLMEKLDVHSAVAAAAVARQTPSIIGRVSGMIQPG
jgi:DNA-binding NarL/FixJ family response regulator